MMGTIAWAAMVGSGCTRQRRMGKTRLLLVELDNKGRGTTVIGCGSLGSWATGGKLGQRDLCSCRVSPERREAAWTVHRGWRNECWALLGGLVRKEAGRGLAVVAAWARGAAWR